MEKLKHSFAWFYESTNYFWKISKTLQKPYSSDLALMRMLTPVILNIVP
jgi:hypothetical protein